MFIGRKQELDYFEEKYTAPGGQLIVLYGRRRIGKTEVLRKFAEGKPHVFYSCRELSDVNQLEAFSKRILSAGSPAAKYISAFKDWDSAFKGILEMQTDNAKKLLIIDEFPYMCKGNSSIPSVLQILWDELLKSQDVMIVLCGSAMSFIEREVLSEKKPLYGRATGIYKMGEMPFDDVVQFFPSYPNEDKMLAYAILGGVPHYLRQFDPALSLHDNIIRNILTKGCVLYSEVEFLVRQEMREPALYNTLIEAVALGNTRLNDIYTKTQIEKSKISVYLKNLIELQILEREFSVLSAGGRAAGSKEQAASTRGLYRISDNFFRFWFSFVFPNMSDLETGDAKGVFINAVLPQLNDFASPAFESVCRAFIRKKNRLNELPFRISKLGRWWGKLNIANTTESGTHKITSVDTEIDIVAVDAQSLNYILGECKFRNAECDCADLDNLMKKSAIVKKDAVVKYALFSKSGFTQRLTARAKEDGSITLYSFSDIIAT